MPKGDNGAWLDVGGTLKPPSVRPMLLLVAGCTVLALLFNVMRSHVEFATNALHDLQTRRVEMQRLDLLLQAMTDAETGVRGYLLVGSPEYLDPYQKSVKDVPGLMSLIAKDATLYPHDKADYEVLRELVQEKMAVLEQGVARGHPQTVRVEGSGPGKIKMDALREIVATIKARREAEDASAFEGSVDRFDLTEEIVTGLSIASLGMTLWLFVIQQRRNELRRRLSALLETENVRLEARVARRTSELSQLATYLTTTREAEREHLARELHDEMGALLTSARMDVNWVLRKYGAELDQQMRERLGHAIEQIGLSITIKRRIIDDLRPALLQGLGLTEALHLLIEAFSREVPVTAELTDALPDLSEDQALALYRIVQEAFTNIRKYARATRVRVGLHAGAGRLVLTVTDDGVGFNPNSPQVNHHGLAGMKHRAQMFGGSFHVRSAPGAGTRITADLPVTWTAPGSALFKQ